jgi:hypothetical protein
LRPYLINMARAFTVLFRFWGEDHTALVTLSDAVKEPTVLDIRILSLDLQNLVGDGSISFSTTDDSWPPAINNHTAFELFFSVKMAVCKYLSMERKFAS